MRMVEKAPRLREELSRYPRHQNDIETIYALREELLKNMDTILKIEILAEKANMSVSKAGRLFKQIFGGSIYNYYQK
jgi:transcriptional regulator GlxA family with amidase domain